MQSFHNKIAEIKSKGQYIDKDFPACEKSLCYDWGNANPKI